MSDTQAANESAIRRLLAEYCHHYDDRRSHDFAALFTEDAVFRVWDRTIEGRDAIRDTIGTQAPDQAPGQHMTYNTVIDVADDGTTATARTDFCYLRADGDTVSLSTAGRYHDHLERQDRWRIARRTIVFLGQSPPDDT